MVLARLSLKVAVPVLGTWRQFPVPVDAHSLLGFVHAGHMKQHRAEREPARRPLSGPRAGMVESELTRDVWKALLEWQDVSLACLLLV
jgi:hypothetical protein